MAIIRSCCFWKSLRKGCIASACYTLVFFLFSFISVSTFVYDERDYLAGKVNKLSSKTFLGESPLTLWFYTVYFGFSCLGVLASILALIGLRKDDRKFLAPLILVLFCDIVISILQIGLSIISGNLKFDPLTATLFILDFFIHCLNSYCLICVVSQYQEYKEFECEDRFMINNRSTTPEKSCIIIHQSKMSPGATNITQIQETSNFGSSHDLSPIPDIFTSSPVLQIHEELASDQLREPVEV